MSKYRGIHLSNGLVVAILASDLVTLARTGMIYECGEEHDLHIDPEVEAGVEDIELLVQCIMKAEAEKRADAMREAPRQAPEASSFLSEIAASQREDAIRGGGGGGLDLRHVGSDRGEAPAAAKEDAGDAVTVLKRGMKRFSERVRADVKSQHADFDKIVAEAIEAGVDPRSVAVIALTSAVAGGKL